MITKPERNWILKYTLFVIILTSIPYLIGFWKQGSNWDFSGFVFGVEDGNSYIAKMESGANGAWLFQTPYTAYPQQGLLAFLPYILLGKLTSSPGQHVQLVALFQIFRWAGCWLVIYAVYQFLALFTDKINHRRLGTAIATIGGGIGWLSLIGLQTLWGGRLPLEFYSPEAFGFLSLFGIPHLLFSRALLILGIVEFLKYQQDGRGNPYKTGLLWLLMGFFQPLNIIIGWLVISTYTVLYALIQWIKKSWGNEDWEKYKYICLKAIWIFVLSSPWVIYSLWSSIYNPFLILWNQQNIILSPPPQDYILAYCLLIPTMILSIRHILRQNEPKGFLLLTWVILLPLLAYFPNNLQRRLTEGIWIVLVAFMVIRLKEIKNHFKLTYLLYSAFANPIILIIGSIFAIWQPALPLYRPIEETSSFNFLEQTGKKAETVLASYQTSNALPAWVPMNTLLGHGPESIHLSIMEPDVKEFYSSNTLDETRISLLKEFGIDYVFWGPEEHSLGSWDPSEAAYLQRIFSESGYQIYRVQVR